MRESYGQLAQQLEERSREMETMNHDYLHSVARLTELEVEATCALKKADELKRVILEMETDKFVYPYLSMKKIYICIYI